MGTLRPMLERDLELVLEWRNRPEVRANMYTNHPISPQEHRAWWSRTEGDSTKQYFLFENEGTPLGVVAFTDLSQRNKTATWAFYSGDPNQRGVGSMMEKAALEYAFGPLGLEKLSCEVLGFNAPVVKFHRKYGFRLEGVFRKHHVTENGRADVYRLAIFKKDWQAICSSPPSTRYKPGARIAQDCSFSQEQIRAFSEVSGDHNPIHLDQAAATRAGFPGTIAHGMLAASIFSKILGSDFPGPGTVYRSQSLTFLRPVVPDQPYRAEVEVLSQVGLRLVLKTTLFDKEKTPVLEGEAEVNVAP